MVSGILSKALITASLFSASTSSSATPHSYFTTTPVVTQVSYHVVKSDESLGLIAQEEYGDPSYWTILWNDNDWVSDPSTLYAGWKLKLRSQEPTKGEDLHEDLAKKLTEHEHATFATYSAASSSARTGPVETPVSEDAYPPSNFDAVYKAAGAKYGVSWQILYGLHLTETGLRNGPIANHSGSGAEGPLQFMPGTWAAYGVDGDGDGKADIDNATDAIYGAANYLQKHGSLANGLRSYGGNTPGVLSAARSRGFSDN